MEINNLDELFAYASDVIEGKAIYEEINLIGNDFAIQIHIDGEDWDKRFDTRIAKYIINLQKNFDDCFEEFDLEGEVFTVKVEAKEGSNIPYTDIFDFLSKVVTPMTPEQTFISIITALAGTAGYFFWARYLTKKEKEIAKNETVEIQTLQNEKDLAFINALQTKAENEPAIFAKYEKTIASLIRTLDNNDKIAFQENEELLPVNEIKSMGPPRMPRSKEETSYADGAYILEKQIDSLGEVIYELSSDGIEVKGYISGMDQNDLEKFMQEIHDRRLTEELPIKIDLQINIVHIKNKIKHGIIQGLGAPRPNKNHKTLQEIINQ